MRYSGTIQTGDTSVDKSLLDLLKKINELASPTYIELVGKNEAGQQIVSTIDWNTADGTINVSLENGVTGQMFQELYFHGIATENIANGDVVQFAGTENGVLTFKKANVSIPSPVTGFYMPVTTLGVATQAIDAGKKGYITWFGRVRDIDTSAFTVGSLLFLDENNPGKMTSSYPSAGSSYVILGVVEVKGINGQMFVRPNWGNRIEEVTLDPTGFDVPANVTVTYNSTDRTISLSGTFHAYWRGSRIPELVSGWTSAPHPVSPTTPYYLYYDGTLPVGSRYVWSTTPWIFSQLQIAYLAADSTGVRFCLRETHGTMGWNSHQEFHQTIGTYLISGGDISNVTISSTTLKYPYISSTMIKDEDNITTNPIHNSGNNYTVAYLTGASSGTLTTGSATIVPVSGSNPYYNLYTGGSWTQSLMLNNTYSSVWLVAMPVTADSGSQLFRYVWLQGQSNGTLSSEQALSPSSLTLGSFAGLSPEYVFIGRVIIRYQSSNWSIEQVDKLTGTRFSQVGSPAGNFLSAVSHSTNLTGLGTPASPLDLAADISVSGTITAGGNLKIGSGVPTQAGDIGVARTASPTTGVIYLGNSGARYLYYDGTNYNLPGGSVVASSFSGAGTGLTGTASSLTSGSANAVSFNGGLTTASSPTFAGMTLKGVTDYPATKAADINAGAKSASGYVTLATMSVGVVTYGVVYGTNTSATSIFMGLTLPAGGTYKVYAYTGGACSSTTALNTNATHLGCISYSNIAGGTNLPQFTISSSSLPYWGIIYCIIRIS